MNATARRASADRLREKIAADPAAAIAAAVRQIDDARVTIAVAATMLDEDRRKLSQLRALVAETAP